MPRTANTAFALAFTLLAACDEPAPNFGMPDEEICLTNRAGNEFCIDTYEASRRDADSQMAGVDDDSGPVSLSARLPWVAITWAGAKMRCEGKGKRLCERDEWIDACDGASGEADGTRFTYGDTLDRSRCNTDGMGVEASGNRPNCKGSTGTFDQSGNVWEWTGNTEVVAAARGGSFKSSQTHACMSGDTMQVFTPTGMDDELGFRCCRDR